MCTATWIVRPGGYELLFNRDERRTRATAAPPRVVRAGGVLAVRPTDADAGGTWIGVNEHGVALALLNRYDGESAVAHGGMRPRGPHPGEARDVRADGPSRGEIPAALLSARSIDEALERLGAMDLAGFRPFDLLVFGPGDRPARASWDTHTLAATRLADSDRPVVSTSFRGADVLAARRETYERLVDGEADLERLTVFHASHDPERGPASACMHRPDARTVSMSRVSVDPERIVFRYAPGPPCRTPLDEEGVSIRRA